MRRSLILSTAAAALLLLVIVATPDARAVGEPQVYDPTAIETFPAEILEISRADLGSGAGLHLVVRNDRGEEIEVRVGPTWYVEEQGIRLEIGDRIEITGVALRLDEVPVFVVARLQRGEQLWTLRDGAGQPAWAGSRVAAGTDAGDSGMGRGQGGGCMMQGQGSMMGGQGQGGMQGRGMMGGQGQGGMRGRGMMHGQGGMQGGMQGGAMGCMSAAAGSSVTDDGQSPAGPMCRRSAPSTSGSPADAGIPPESVGPAGAGCSCGCAMGTKPEGRR